MTKAKFQSVLLALVQGLFIGVLIIGAINFLLGTSLPLPLGAIIGAIGGVIYGLLPSGGSQDES